jgi:sporulation protein YlmC with PRC-barrel domain
MRTFLVTATLAATAVLARPAVVLAPQAMAQGAPQTVQLMKVDVVKVSTGYRASKVIGSSVVNEAGDTVGKVDEIIVGPDGKAPFVVLSVGGFLGIGDKLVALPYEQMKTDGKKIVLPGATKDSLKALPEFKYAS